MATWCMLWAWLPRATSSVADGATAFRIHRPAGVASPCLAPAGNTPGRGEADPTALLTSAQLMLRTAPAVIAVSFAGSSRSFLLPLKAAELKHGNAIVGLLYGFSFVFDVLCAPLGAWLMDRRGRKYSGVGMLLGSSLGWALISQISGRGKRAQHGLWLGAALIGASSGLSVGLVATLGSDIAPVARRSEFLGLWKTVPLAGTLAGPLVVGSIAGNYSLDTACQVVALVLLAAGLGYGLLGLETLQGRVEQRRGTADVELRNKYSGVSRV